MRSIAKTVFTLISICCMFLLLAIAGGSDADILPLRQALKEGTIATVCCIVSALGAVKLGEKQP